MAALRPCRFRFEDTPAFPGFSYGTRWNGFDNVAVSPDVLRQIAEHFRRMGDKETADDLMEIPPDESGLVSLAGSHATRIVATEERA